MWRSQCTCRDDKGRRAKVDPEFCAAETTFGKVKKQDYQVASLVDARGYPAPSAPLSKAELDVFAWMSKAPLTKVLDALVRCIFAYKARKGRVFR